MPAPALSLALAAEHAEEAAFLWLQRGHAVRAPHHDPQQFHALDEQLSASLDGLQLAGDVGRTLAHVRLADGGPEDFFVAATLALTASDGPFDAIVERAQAVPEARRGLASALGWMPARQLAGRVPPMLAASDPLRMQLGVAACALHRKDPGPVLASLLDAPSGAVRRRVARAAGELGRLDLQPALAALADADAPALRHEAAQALLWLGDLPRAVAVLGATALAPGPRQRPALELASLAADLADGRTLLRQLDGPPSATRLRIVGAGLTGDLRHIPWLLDQLTNPATARIAFEAFVTICGPDVNAEQMESFPPEGYDDGPSDDPDDDDVELPEDVALPWPNVERVKAWWMQHRAAFPADTKLFLGRPPSVDWCRHVLKTGFQRQRVHAAQHLCLVAPGRPLFPTSAPAWRQQRLMAQW